MKELSKEIIRQAEKEAEKIIKNAKKEAEALIEKAKAEAKQEIKKERKKARKEKERLFNREKIKANIEGKKIILNTKKEVLERVFQEFLKKVLDMKEKEKTELYRSLVKNAEKEIKSGTIYVRKQDVKIVKKLTEYQLEAKAYFVPFGELQYAVISSVPSRYRMIVYRRVMARVANEIATKEKAHAIITGDSMGQVASQTIENLRCIYDASFLPVLPPLIGMDKREIVEMAKKIGTYEISIKPYDDCCSFMVAKHPATRASIEKIKEMEKRLEFDIARMLERAVVKKFSIR